MLNGVLVAFGIMIASLIIPVVHYVAAPLSPFIAGFIGSGVAKIDQDGIIKFGALVALLMFIPAFLILVLKFVVGMEQIFTLPITLVMVLAVMFIPYTWFGVTVGALGGHYIRRNQE